MAEACDSVCSAFASLGCANGGEADCSADCVAANENVPFCQSWFLGMNICLAEKAKGAQSCEEVVTACEGEHAKYTSCVDAQLAGCQEQICGGSTDADYCWCVGSCGGEEVKTHCTKTADGFFCECSRSGALIGTCTAPTFSCGITYSPGCCLEYFDGTP